MPQRIRTLDHVRGLSILAILLVNAIAFAQPFIVYTQPNLSPVPLSQADLEMWWLTETFFTGKFITLFSLLFGVSVWLVGRDRRPADPAYATPLFRRLLWLAVFGLIHGALIWHGDILLSYALTGFVFWRWQGASARSLLLWGGLLFVAGNALLTVPQLFVTPGETADYGDLAAIVARMRGGFFDSLGQNFAVWASSESSELLGYMPVTLGLMMLGLGLFKTGFFSGEMKLRTSLLLIAGGAISLALIGWQARISMTQGFPWPQMYGLYALANAFLCLPAALAYVSILILLGRTKPGGVLLHPLACAGQMAFTNYLMQSLIMTGLFYGGRGPGLFGTMNPAALLPIVATILGGQLVFSTIWMAVFRYGPFEWLWRCLTWQRWVDIRKA